MFVQLDTKEYNFLIINLLKNNIHMKNLFIYLIILSSSIKMNCQQLNNKSIFVMIDSIQNEQLFILEKNKNNVYANIRILKYDKRKEGFNNKETKIKSKNDIIQVNPEPNIINYYEFRANNPPQKLNSLKGLKLNSIQDVSKNKKNVWSKYPYTIFFVEKLEKREYNLWEMNLIIYE